MSDDYPSLQSWDSPALSLDQTPSDVMSRPVSMHQDMYPPTSDGKSELIPSGNVFGVFSDKYL
jgi:hypothetical protein